MGLKKDLATNGYEKCLQCEGLECKKNCDFLSFYDLNARELAEIFRETCSIDPVIPFSCDLCHLCGKVCPEGIEIGNLCHEIRQKAVKEDLALLSQHKPVQNHQKWVSSVVFRLALADPHKKKMTPRVFFPGCNLPAYSPELVLKTYNYLRTKLPGTGIILNCCYAPTYMLGDMTQFKKFHDRIENQMKSLGASEIITACSQCYNMLKEYGTATWQIHSLYEVLLKVGLPHGTSCKMNKVFSVHDSCPARYEEKFRHGARQVMKELGYGVEEMEFSGEKTRCCGGGGLIEYVDPGLFEKIASNRADEAPYDIATYCAGCRENFASLKKPALHILDLLFNPNWEESRKRPPQRPNQKWKNMWVLKRLLKRL